MAITVREIVEGIINENENTEVDVDFLEEVTEKIDRVDIVEALKQMEDEGLGIFMKGRRGKKSRFVKGVQRAKNILNKESLDNLREAIKNLNDQDVMLASFPDCEEKATEDQIDELGEYRGKPYASQFFNDNTSKAVEALKLLQREGLGSFLIGRRGKFSRFVKGVSKDELQNRPKGIIPKESIVEERDPKYMVVHNIILKNYDEGEFDSLPEAMNSLGVDDESLVKESINKLGYYIVK
jgi:hypothetical protein